MKENKAVQKTTGFFKEFKDFISKGNVIDLAVGVIIGSSFTAIVNSLVNNIITPLITLLTGKVSVKELFIALDGNEYESLEAATEAGVATLGYGLFIQAIIDFIIICCLSIGNKITFKFLNFSNPKAYLVPPSFNSRSCFFIDLE